MTSRVATRKKPIPTGYTACACRDCMELAIRGPGEKEPYCADCEAAGCADCQGVSGISQECRAAGAYGGDDTA
jgi:hypothetical protein